MEERIHCNFVISKETYRFETGFCGRYKRGREAHTFQIAAKIISASIHELVHKNACSKIISHKLSTLCGNSADGLQMFDAIQLTGVLEMKYGDKIKRKLHQV